MIKVIHQVIVAWNSLPTDQQWGTYAVLGACACGAVVVMLAIRYEWFPPDD